VSLAKGFGAHVYAEWVARFAVLEHLVQIGYKKYFSEEDFSQPSFDVILSYALKLKMNCFVCLNPTDQ
jgi:hypothetical protein